MLMKILPIASGSTGNSMLLDLGGKTILIETKGDHLENTETKYKLELGRAWQNMAGSSFRYYMVFQSKDLNLNGAIQFDKFCELMKNL